MILWSHTPHDLREVVELKVQEGLVNHMQTLEHLKLAAIFALGGKSDPEDEAPETFEDLAGIMSAFGGGVGG